MVSSAGPEHSEDDLWLPGDPGDLLRCLAGSDLIAVVTATRQGRITAANGAFLRLVGYDRADLTAGRLDWRMITPADWAAVDEAALDELAARGSCARLRKEFVHRDGSRIPVEVSGWLLSRDPLSLAWFARDTSAEQQARDAARRAAELAELAAVLGQAVTVAEVAQALADGLRQSAGTVLATVVEADPVRQVLRFVSLQGVPGRVAGQFAEFDASLDSPAVRAWRGREPLFYPSPQVLDREFPHLAEARRDAGTGSCLAAPLITGGQVTGVLAVALPAPRQLTTAERSFLDTVTGYAAQALARARLFQAEQVARAAAEAARDQAVAAARQVRALQAVTAGLATMVTTDQVAATLAERGLSLITAHGVVALLEPPGNHPPVDAPHTMSAPDGSAHMKGGATRATRAGHPSRSGYRSWPSAWPTRPAAGSPSWPRPCSGRRPEPGQLLRQVDLRGP